MLPTPFTESNRTLSAPPGMSDCLPLPVHSTAKDCISCWSLSWRERLSALLFGRVWLNVVGMKGTQPPVSLSCRRTCFTVRPSLPRRWRRLVRQPAQYDPVVSARHGFSVPLYPFAVEVTQEGPFKGKFVFAYGCAAWSHRSLETADATAREMNWHPDRRLVPGEGLN